MMVLRGCISQGCFLEGGCFLEEIRYWKKEYYLIHPIYKFQACNLLLHYFCNWREILQKPEDVEHSLGHGKTSNINGADKP